MADAMRAWIVPLVVLLAVGLGGFGGGYAVNEWRDEDVSVAEVVATPTGPSQAEIDAERQREEDALCLEAQQAASAAESVRNAKIQQKVEELGFQNDLSAQIVAASLVGGMPPEIQQAIDRYCR